MLLAAGGPPGKEAAFFSRQAVGEGVALEDGEVVQSDKCSCCWWQTLLRRLKWWWKRSKGSCPRRREEKLSSAQVKDKQATFSHSPG